MRHLVDGRRLGRTTPHRLALLRNMAVSLVRYGRIQTTLPKAKELRSLAERLVTLGKKGTLSARRQARRWINDRECLSKLFDDLAKRFETRAGGYTRIMKSGYRDGDQAPMAYIEYLDNPEKVIHKEKKRAAKEAKVAKAEKEPKEEAKKEKKKTTKKTKKNA